MNNFLHSQGYNKSTIAAIKRKGIFPYELITDVNKLELKELPNRDQFFSSLTDEDVTQEEFEFAQSVFKEANCQSIRDYLKIYLLSDVLL